jgi:hypothetical protein
LVLSETGAGATSGDPRAAARHIRHRNGDVQSVGGSHAMGPTLLPSLDDLAVDPGRAAALPPESAVASSLPARSPRVPSSDVYYRFLRRPGLCRMTRLRTGSSPWTKLPSGLGLLRTISIATRASSLLQFGSVHGCGSLPAGSSALSGPGKVGRSPQLAGCLLTGERRFALSCRF